MRSFSQLTNLRNISFNGYNSLTDFNALITTKTKINDITPRRPSVALPYRQGIVRCSGASGVTMYDARELSYEFKLIEDTVPALQNKISAVSAWLMSKGADTITDSKISGYHFADCECTGISTKIDDSVQKPIAYLTAKFTAYPFEVDGNGGERL